MAYYDVVALDADNNHLSITPDVNGLKLANITAKSYFDDPEL